MSKEIFLYSEDKKYKCCFELADSLDKFKCPDHSVMILFEERKNGTYIIAQARDKILETEKDQKIANLEAKLEQSQKEKELDNAFWKQECDSLQKALAEKDKNNLILYSMLYETLEKQGCENVASQIDQMTGFTLDKQAEWFKGNRNCDDLLKLLAEKEKEIEEINREFVQSTHDWKELVKEKTQDKISFAIEQLEKVYEYTADVWWVDGVSEAVCNFIDQQIKELKEKTNVKD